MEPLLVKTPSANKNKRKEIIIAFRLNAKQLLVVVVNWRAG